MTKLFLSLAVTVSTLVLAQENTKPSSSPVSFGLKAGFNLSRVSSDYAEFKAGFNGGAFVNIPVSSKFSVQPEVIYNGLGAQHYTYYYYSDYYAYYVDYTDARLNLDYISVPVMLQYNILPELYVEAGPQFGFLVGTHVRVNGESVKVKKDYEGFDFGIGLGVGYYFTPNIGITGRYTAGITDILKNNPGSSVSNNAFQIGMAYNFR